jgi:nucleoid-associated protein YgaU
MQQIERFGVIALVFLLITIVAVSFWGDSKSPGFWSRLTGHAKQEPTADHILPPASSTDTALTPPAPLDLDPKSSLATDVSAPVTPIAAPKNDALANHTAAAPGTDISPTQPVTPPAAPAANTGEYVVQKGDSLALIARRTLGKESRWTEIAAINPGLTPKNLRVGAKIALPTGATASAAPTTAPTSAPTTAAKTKSKAGEPAPKPKSEVAAAPEKKVAAGPSCKVQKGDTFKAIARRELGSDERWKEIAELNPGVSSSKLAVGQTLRLPERGHATEVASLASATPDNKPHVR